MEARSPDSFTNTITTKVIVTTARVAILGMFLFIRLTRSASPSSETPGARMCFLRSQAERVPTVPGRIKHVAASNLFTS